MKSLMSKTLTTAISAGLLATVLTTTNAQAHSFGEIQTTCFLGKQYLSCEPDKPYDVCMLLTD
ncbi:hypothetical protein ACFBZI_02190 [Moraxella sp. ZJ142]|uniref:hypothetical protein n=1 Tax=Moraxella marmotae TaxID=3344520 RepID=UPI0035D466AC